jgi:membrane-bound lytic murein transglycosylase A
VAGSLTESSEFREPILARPADLVSFAPGEGPPGFDPMLAGARRRLDGILEPYPERAEIEAARRDPIVWLADAVEAFFIHVQGSARVKLPDRREMRLVYDGRNGQPYTSIGRELIESGEIAAAEMSLERLKAWLRKNGLSPGERGREILRRNRSYIFFRLAPVGDPAEGPTGGAGVALTALRSIAVDRRLWSYGLPFWIEAELPWREDRLEPFRRLMVAQDTGTAIVGPARFDLFFGSGEAAGVRAGAIRHACRAWALEPRESLG